MGLGLPPDDTPKYTVILLIYLLKNSVKALLVRLAIVNTSILVRVTGAPGRYFGRGAGTVMVDRGGVERDGITVLSWQVCMCLCNGVVSQCPRA